MGNLLGHSIRTSMQNLEFVAQKMTELLHMIKLQLYPSMPTFGNHPSLAAFPKNKKTT